jgi:class 3 adenylate cyclase
VFEKRYKNDVPMIASITVACTFLLVVVALVGYENYVRRRDEKVTIVAAVAGGIVSSLFPSEIRTLLFEPTGENRSDNVSNLKKKSPHTLESKPIACFFPDTTVLFADIAGFTAWSALRPPQQVFMLLETLFGRLDRIARRLGVYKVETIGDCYVAVTGLPDPQPLHAVIITQFAILCSREMKDFATKMKSKLGDSTQQLSMRFGLHSGPVTAGVLRGERSRFQLFGETVNIAALLEKTGLRDRIHVSNATAGYLIQNGKELWLRRRAQPVTAKGGRQIQTYWIEITDNDDSEVIEFSTKDEGGHS